MGWGTESSSSYIELQGNPAHIHLRQRARKRRVDLIERILTEDRGKKTSTSKLKRDSKLVYDRLSSSED